MISEMVETRDRIQNEFYEEFENMSQKFIGKPIDASVLYTLERYMEAVAQRISAENGVHIISGKVRANISGTVMVEEPEIEMADGSTRKLSEAGKCRYCIRCVLRRCGGMRIWKNTRTYRET